MVKHNIRLLIDIIMTVGIICLMNTSITGLLLHKILGMIMLFFIIIHITINFDNIKKYRFRFLDKTFKISLKATCIFNIIIGILLVAVIFTGKSISMISSADIKMMTVLHKVLAVFTFVGISIHLGLHWNQVMIGLKSCFKIQGKNKLRTILLRISVVLVIVTGLGCSQESVLKMILHSACKMVIFTSVTYYISEMNRRKRLNSKVK